MAVVPIGRLRAGVGREAAQERIDALARSIPPELDRVEVRGARLDGLLWRADMRRIFDLGMAVMLGTAALLLLIACVNVAGMMVARSFDRRREISVRLAIGAGPGRLVRQMLVESVLVALIGGAAGVLLPSSGPLSSRASRSRWGPPSRSTWCRIRRSCSSASWSPPEPGSSSGSGRHSVRPQPTSRRR